jgi:hypothetical protein
MAELSFGGRRSDLDLDVLKARVKKLLKDGYGEILQIREQQA